MSKPASRLRLLAQGVSQLPADINGEVDGPEYEPYLLINDMRAVMSTRKEVEMVWGGRRMSLASNEEENAFVVLEGQWDILSVREGYWYSDRDAEAEVFAGGKPNRVNVSTIDFVLTRCPLPPSRLLRYLAVSSKPLRVAESQKGRVRHAREQSYATPRGWGWVHLKPPREQAVTNHKTLRRWILPSEGSIDELDADARELAALLYSSTSSKPLDGLLRMTAKRLGIQEGDQYPVFCAAYYLGYLGLNHDQALDPSEPLSLAPAPRWKTSQAEP